MSGGIQANTDKADPQWIHSGEPGTSGREPFEEDGASGIPRQQHHERQHHGHHGDIQGGGVGSGLTGAGAGTGAGFGSDSNVGERGIASSGLGGATTGEHHHHHHHHQGQPGISDETLGRTGVTGERGYDNNNVGSGIGAAGAGSLAGAGSGGRGYDGAESGLTGGQGATGGYKDFDNKPSFGSGAGTGATGTDSRSGAFDRVGDRNEGGALYERTTDQGPVTGGAAGTDRFDSDRHRGTGNVGRDVGTGNARGVGDVSEDSAYERTGGGELGATSGSRGSAGTSTGPTTGTGGALSGLTTTDDEFTGKNRSHTGPNVPTGAGAYEDTSGPFKGNTSGPGGNTALTGREGSTGQNPVAQASSTGAGAGEPTGRVGQEEHAGESKGFVQKIKDLL